MSEIEKKAALLQIGAISLASYVQALIDSPNRDLTDEQWDGLQDRVNGLTAMWENSP